MTTSTSVVDCNYNASMGK